jgi:hypothetical protein
VTGWGEDSILVGLVERQFEHLLSHTGPKRLLFLSRLLSFIEGEPKLSGILADLRHETDEARAWFQVAEERIRTEVAAQWVVHKREIQQHLARRLADAAQAGEILAYGSMESFEARLASAPSIPPFDARAEAELESVTGNLVLALRHWRSWAVSEAEEANEPVSPGLRDLADIVDGLRRDHSLAIRRSHLAYQTLGWPAFERLRAVHARLYPAPPKRGTEAPVDSMLALLLLDEAEQLALAIHTDGSSAADDQRRVAAMVDEVGTDAKTLREELILRIGQGRSRLAIVRRYAARCEAFEADRLRAACAAAPTRAERLLTNDFARFLFDAGLSPLLSASASGLQPDILHVEPSSLFYVEAKQYHAKNPREQVKKAYAQVWSTWGRLRKTYPCDEAFLVVFRRGGPYVELPPVIRWAGLRLYSLIVDISEEAGSREKVPGERITEEDLQPTREASARWVSRVARAATARWIVAHLTSASRLRSCVCSTRHHPLFQARCRSSMRQRLA